jgi:hypothetical protein
MSEYTNPLPSLQKLSLPEQAAFALACAIRIGALGEVQLSVKASELFGRTLLTTQTFIATGEISPDLQAQSEALESLDELDDDRVAAAAYLLRHLITREPENAEWVAQRASDACGFLVDRAIEHGVSN